MDTSRPIWSSTRAASTGSRNVSRMLEQPETEPSSKPSTPASADAERPPSAD
jgi:hypothetical protein